MARPWRTGWRPPTRPTTPWLTRWRRSPTDEAHGHHFGTAAAHLLSASQLSSAPEQAEARLLRAARLLLAAGQTAQVNALRPRLEECPPSPARSLVLGMMAWDHGEPVLAEKLLTEAAGLGSGKELGPGDVAETATAADALAQLSVIYVAQVRAREAVDAAAAALAYGPVDPRTERTATMSAALGEAMLYGAPAGLDRLSGRLPADPERAEPCRRRPGHHQGHAAPLRRAYGDQGSPICAQHVRSARHVATTLLPRAHLHLSQLLFDAGEWDEALVQGRVALSLLSDERRTWVEAQVHATLSRLLASRGQWAEAEAQLAAAQTAATELGTPEASGTTMRQRRPWPESGTSPRKWSRRCKSRPIARITVGPRSALWCGRRPSSPRCSTLARSRQRGHSYRGSAKRRQNGASTSRPGSWRWRRT